MEKTYFSTIDELGRVLIKKELRNELSWPQGSALQLSLNEETALFELKVANDGNVELDPLSRVNIPKHLLDTFGLCPGDKIAMALAPNGLYLKPMYVVHLNVQLKDH